MEFIETKPNIYKYTIDGVIFLFRIWEDEILEFHPEREENASFRYGNDPQYGYDTFFSDEITKDKKILKLYVESVSKMLVEIYKRSL